jgi:MoaA/NifB/PqqE/SkfB family radical SAM enzyme
MEQLMQKLMANRQLNEAEIKMKKVILNSHPRMLVIVLTNKCNLRCIMCSRVYSKDNFTLPLELAEQIYKLLPYLEDIDLQGGEIFLVDYLKKLFCKINEYPYLCKRIVTNGLLINQEWKDIFAESKNVELTYSIDAVTKTTYEKIRIGAKFSDLLKSINLINEANNKCSNSIRLRINAVVMRSNYKEISLFPEFCKRYNFQHLRFDFLRPDVMPQEDILLKSNDSIVSYLKRSICEVKDACQELNIGFEYTFESLISKLKQKVQGPPINNSPSILKCKLPWKKLFIDIGGVIFPDCLCKHSLGSIGEPIEKIWNNERMQLYRQRLSSGLIDDWCSKTCIVNAVDPYQLEGV